MPFSGTFTEDGAGILQVGRGVVTGEELLVETQRVASDPASLAAIRYALIDFSQATEFQVTAAEMARIAAEDQDLARVMPEVNIVVVAPTPLMFGMARMWEALTHATGWQIRVVASRAEALSLLRSERTHLSLD